MTPAVSVVLPYRDAASTLDEALASLRAQSLHAIEVIAVDDGSTDGGAGIVARYAARDDRFRAVRSPGLGIPGALSLGVAHARAPLLARMDGDDVAHPERLAAQVEALALAPRVGALGTRVEGFPEGGVGEGFRAYIDWQNGLLSPDDHARELFVESPLCHPSVVLRREALEAVGGYVERVWAEDYDLWLRLDAAGWWLAKVDRVLLRWRHQASRATLNDGRYAAERFREAKAHYLAPRLRALGRPVWIWGAGATGRRFARALEPHGLRVSQFVDIDPRKIGGVARGAPIGDVERLVASRGACVVLVAVGARGARGIVRARLARLGFVEGGDFFCVS